MKKIALIPVFFFALIFASFLDCNGSEKIQETSQNTISTEDQETSPDRMTILPLGDSRVEGATANSVSYRYDLWKSLVENRWNFDYIGSQYDQSSYPVLLGQYFDPDHEGIGGWKTQDVLDNIGNIIEDSGIPDVVLLGVGGNDLVANIAVSQAITNINETIDILQNNNSNVTIFVERIAPGRSNVMTSEAMEIYTVFNNSITTLANEQSTSSSRVIAVDMSANWTDAYMADNLHYNALGAKEVADRYYAAMEIHLN